MAEKLSFLILAIAMPMMAHGNSIGEGPEAVQEWFKNLPNAKEKVTKLHLYMHDVIGGKNPTVITVAQSNYSLNSPTMFGLTRMMDNALTVGPDHETEPQPESNVIGRAQGIYGAASMEEIGLLMTFNFVFTHGEYNGSTLSVLGHNPFLHRYREMPVVGGSGVFRLARGIATANTVWVNITSQCAVIEYNVIVLHY
ncbi:Dirigent protein 23 [Sesamum alatum]|uniref:Dirigent protein n=1 Tax=Sesamum alatum TaxID=300844 RepID=A0AAE1YWR9_9LAMI|nr:Dirigent protein 23 [Sesamum alatum]